MFVETKCVLTRASVSLKIPTHGLPGAIVVRDVRERGRDIEGCIKQWFGFVKPNFEKVSPNIVSMCGTKIVEEFC